MRVRSQWISCSRAEGSSVGERTWGQRRRRPFIVCPSYQGSCLCGTCESSFGLTGPSGCLKVTFVKKALTLLSWDHKVTKIRTPSWFPVIRNLHEPWVPRTRGLLGRHFYCKVCEKKGQLRTWALWQIAQVWGKDKSGENVQKGDLREPWLLTGQDGYKGRGWTAPFREWAACRSDLGMLRWVMDKHL